MTSMFRKAISAQSFSNGEGGFVLKLIVPNQHGANEQIEYELTAKRCARLIEAAGWALKQLLPEDTP